MYGNKNEDPVVKYYDISLAIGSKDEIPFYIDVVTNSGGPVLDLGCGTGRLSIEFAKQAFNVAAVDNSTGMLDIFKEKLNKQPKEIQDKIEIYKAPFNNFSLQKKYKTIVCTDAFFHNLSIAEEKQFLECVREHMSNDSCFVFNIHNPNPQFLTWASSEESSKYKLRGEYPIPNTSNKLRIEQKLNADLLSQIIETNLRYTVLDEKRCVVEQSFSSWKARYIFRYEAIHLLSLCGFKVISLVGNYKKEPVNINSQLIFTVKKI